MTARSKSIRSFRLFGSLVLGVGLTVGLLLTFSLRLKAEGQAVNPGLAADPTSGAGLAQVASEEAVEVARTSAGAVPAPAPAAAPPAAPSGAGRASLFASAGDFAGVGSRDAVLLTPPLPGSVDLALCMTSDRVWGIVGAGETATVTVGGAQMGAALADGNGFFWTTLYDGNGDRPNLGDGTQVRIYTPTQIANLTLRSVTGTLDFVNDVVSGTIGGAGFPISVTVYAYEALYTGQEPPMTSYSQTVSTDGSGNFSADFTGIWDFIPWDDPVVAYVEGGVEVHQHVYPATSLMVRAYPNNWVFGRAAPDEAVTVTLYLSDSVTVKGTVTGTAGSDGFYFTTVSTDVLESDVVFAELAGGTVMSRTIDRLTAAIDAANDRVTGLATPFALVRGVFDNVLTSLGPRSVQVTTTADATGVYTLEFGAVADLMPGHTVAVFVADAEGDDLNPRVFAPSVEVQQTWNEVSGFGYAPFGLADGRPVTLTLYSAISDTIFTYTKDMEGPYGSYRFNQDQDNLPDIAPGDVVTVESAAWQGVVQVQTMTVQHDMATDRFTGTVETPPNRVELWGAQWADWNLAPLFPVGGSFDMLVTATSPFTGTPAGFDVRNSVGYEVRHRTANEYLERIYAEVDGFRVWLDANLVLGLLSPPDTPYTITLRDSGGSFKAQLTGTSGDPIGHIGWNQFGGANIETGDQVQVQSAAGFSQTVHVPPMTIELDEANDTVSGTGPINSLLYVGVNDQDMGFVPTDSNGQYIVAVDQLQQRQGDGEVEWGDLVQVCYFNEDANRACLGFNWPQITAHYDMEGSSQVWGSGAIPGNTIYITVTDPGSTVVATGTTSAGTAPWAGPNGYQLQLLDGAIVPSNTVTVNWGDGFVDSTEVITITANPDVDTEIVTGTAPADGWLDANAEHAWGDWVDINNVQVDASGVYTLDFGAEGWDIQYGDRFNIHYNADHGHQTQYSFWIPAPELGIDKQNTPGHARPGGVVVYGINYWNDGNGVATDTLIVDTLPMSTTWAGDTSGVTPVSGPGGVITWNMGDLDARDSGGFMVTLNVFGTVPTGTGVITPNCALITSTTPGDYNPDNNGPRCAGSVDVWDDDVDVEVRKWPYPDDPTPGQEFEYHFDTCNNRGAAVGSVLLTDTLPLSTTFVGWSSDSGDTTYWTEVVTTGGQVVLYAPGLPGDMCERLQLRLLLDADVLISTTLENTIVISTAGDVNPDNNERVNRDAHVSGPRYDMRVDKSFNNGVLVPDGWINYHVSYKNQGNIATHAWITDELPSGTSYRPGSARERSGGPPFPPITVTEDYVVWDLGIVGVNEGFGFDFTLDISDTLTPGQVLTNCATVGITATEETPWDNYDCIATTIYTAGVPNLYVIKQHQDEYQPGNGNINYRIQLGNYGNQTVYNVHLTDTFPISTTSYPWENWPQVNWWGSPPTVTSNYTDSQWLFLFERIEPGQSGEIYLSVNLDDPNMRLLWYTNTVEIETPINDANPADNDDTDVVFSGGEVDAVEIWMNTTGSSNMWGNAQPGTTVTVTTPYTQVTGWADPNCGGCWNIDDVGLVDPGDTITVEAGSGIMPVIIHVPDPFTAEADSTADTVSGQIGGWTNEMVEVYGDWSGGYKEVPTDGSGYYTATYGNVPRGGDGYVRYVTEINYANVIYHRPFQAPDLLLNVHYADDWVMGRFEAGHTVYLTITNDSGAVKATATVSTTPGGYGWGGDGFNTGPSPAVWTPSNPDIVATDWVTGRVDSGQTTGIHVGTIGGNVNAASDSISGTITATWITETVSVECQPWGAPGPPYPPSKSDTVMPDGVDTYSCSWNPATEWNVLPGQRISVFYWEPDNDVAGNAFHEPAPDVHVQKWVEGGGETSPGGTIVYNVRYHNNGDAAATGVVLTDTIPFSTTYNSDSSGFTAYPSGNVVTWTLGILAPQSQAQFHLVLDVDSGAVASDTIASNVITITAGNYEPPNWMGDNRADSGDIHVSDEFPDLYVNKHPNPGDPAPGQTFLYQIDYGNQGPVASGLVLLTDTLPLSTTFVSWSSQNNYMLWSEVITTGGQFVLSAPALPGNWGDSIYLTLRVSDVVTYGTQLTNTVEITTTGDSDSGNNSDMRNDVWVGSPRWDVYVDKDWGWGQLVPGRQIGYYIHYGNNGNMATQAWLTDTLPAGTTFITSTRWTGTGEEAVPPAYVGGGIVVWDLGVLEPGERSDLNLRLVISLTVELDTVITNCATIDAGVFEENPYDNSECVTDTVRASGTNLRVVKSAQWHNWDHIEYRVHIENVGTTTVYGVAVTDTYPVSMTMNWWNLDFWEGWSGNASGNQVTVTLNRLEPGWSTWLSIDLSVPAVPHGTFFTNTVEMTTPSDDVNKGDNRHVVVVGTGPDLSVEKWLTGGTPRPGELLTYTLHFENHSNVWWTNGNVWITDTLLSGLECVTATQRLCGPGNYFCVAEPSYRDSTTWAWNQGSWGSNTFNDLVVTVRVTDTAQGGDLLTNTAIIASSEPVSDTEPYYDDNTSTYVVTVLDPVFEVGKIYESSRVAGTVVTYTLTVTNSGNYLGTGVVLSDTLPAGLTYGGGDGSYDGTAITWTLSSIAPNGGTETGWFSATLPCTAGLSIVNDTYLIVTSTEGVDSAVGAAVALNVVAPTLDAAFDQSATAVLVNSTVYFTDTSTTDGASIDEREWDFGDGSAHVFTQDANHTYTSDDTFTVRLTVTDTCDYSDVQTATVTVTPECIVVTSVGFTYAPLNPVIQSPVTFTAIITPSNADTPITYAWDFGDGGTGSGQEVNHTYALSDTYTVVVTATNCSGAGEAIHTEDVAVILTEGDQTLVDPDTGGTLVYTDTQGNPTTVEVPGEAVTESITLLFTPVSTPTQSISPNLRFAGHFFDLDAYLGNSLLPGFVFSKPVTITIHYSDADVQGVNEISLTLYYWDEGSSAWVDAACGDYDRHPDENWLAVPICHLTKFGLAGVRQYDIYLPLTLRNYSSVSAAPATVPRRSVR